MSLTITTDGNRSITIPSGRVAIPIHQNGNANSIHGVRLKVERANKHINDINTIITDWSKPHGFFIERNPNRTEQVIKFRGVEPISEMLPIIVGEVLFQLKSALDLLACCLAIANHRGTSDVKFPICASKKEFEGERGQAPIKKLSAAAKRCIARLKPYKGGNDLLWAMSTLRNKDGHISLLPLIIRWPVLTTTGTFEDIIHNDIGDSLPFIAHVPIAFSQASKKDVVIATINSVLDIKIQHNMEPMINIAFDDIKGFEGEPIVAILQQFIDLTTRIVNIFERRFFNNRHTKTP